MTAICSKTIKSDIHFYMIPDLDTLLERIKIYVSKPRSERSDDLDIGFAEEVKIAEEQVQESLRKHPGYKDLISYKTRDDDTVESITLKSRSHYLLEMMPKNNGKLSLAKEDIIENGASLQSVLSEAARNNLQELVVPKEALKVLSTKGESIFLSAVEYMLEGILEGQSVKVTCENPNVIKKLLEACGNDGERGCFFIKDKPEETCCRTISRETFLKDCRELLLKEIKDANVNKTFEISTLYADENTLLALCKQLNTKGAKGHLIASDFGKVAEETIKAILKDGVQRFWNLSFTNTKHISMANLVKGMKKDWALNCNPISEKELNVAFYPSDFKEERNKKILEIFENKFKKVERTYSVLPQYWKLDTVSVLKAADNLNSKVNELVFDVDDKEASKTLASGIRAFCQEVKVQRDNWQITVNFGNKKDKRKAFKDALEENKIENNQQRIILSTEEDCKGVNIDFFYSLIVETVFQHDVNKMLKTRNIDQRVDVSGKGVITFVEKHTSMPAFKSELRKDIITSYNAEDKPVKKTMLTLQWTDEWTKWFADPTTDFGEFIEALAEHPEILCVDSSIMAKDSTGHKKYLTEDAVKQLLKVNGVRFVCRYMPDGKAGSPKDWETWGSQCGLSFVKCNGKIAQLNLYRGKENTTEKGDGGWLQVYSKGRYVVAKTENGKRRLLWNRATLKDILKASKKKNPPKRELLAAFADGEEG